MTAQLVVVATPIGNMGDLSPRAVEALRTADLVACEDTRRAGRLLELSGVGHRPLVRVDEHTQRDQLPRLLDVVESGGTVVLVSDAGTPLVSDPGESVVAAFLAAGHPVSTVPGPSAALAALVVSGLRSERFCFEGFLPRRGQDRADRIATIAADPRSTVVYESPKRIAKTLADLAELVEPTRRVSLSRELTKLHEQTWRGTLAEAVSAAPEMSTKGELVLVIEGNQLERVVDDDAIVAALAASTAESTRSRIDEVVATMGVARRRVYDLAHRR